MTVESVIQLSCSCNQYPWGKQGHDSISARLCEKTPGWDGEKADKEFKIDDSKAYAEKYSHSLYSTNRIATNKIPGGWAHTPFFPRT